MTKLLRAMIAEIHTQSIKFQVASEPLPPQENELESVITKRYSNTYDWIDRSVSNPYDKYKTMPAHATFIVPRQNSKDPKAAIIFEKAMSCMGKFVIITIDGNKLLDIVTRDEVIELFEKQKKEKERQELERQEKEKQESEKRAKEEGGGGEEEEEEEEEADEWEKDLEKEDMEGRKCPSCKRNVKKMVERHRESDGSNWVHCEKCGESFYFIACPECDDFVKIANTGQVMINAALWCNSCQKHFDNMVCVYCGMELEDEDEICDARDTHEEDPVYCTYCAQKLFGPDSD